MNSGVKKPPVHNPPAYHEVLLKHTEPGISEPKEIRPPFSGPSLVFDPSDAKASKQASE